MQRVLAGCRPSAVPRLAGSPPPLPLLAGLGAPILPPRRSCSRTVAARDRKLTGRNTETIPHDSGGGGSYNNRHGGGGGGGGGDGSDGSSGDGHSDEPNPRRLLLLATLKWLAAAALVAAALLAALPAMLSHPAGLKLVLAAVNLASPLALTVHLDAVQLGWQQPLLLSGLRLVERSASSGEGDYSSSDDEEPLPVQTALVQPDSAASSSGSGSGQPSSRLRVLRRKGAAPAAPAADAGQAAAADGAAAGGRRRRTLVSVERISTTRTLWQLLRGGGAVDCVVAKPQIDCTLNAAGNPRLLAALQQAKVVPKAHPAPAQQAAGTAAVAALAVPSTTALAGQPAGQSAAGGGGGKGGQGGSKEQAASRQPAAGVAAAAAGASKQRRHDDSSDSEAEEPSLPVRSAAGPRGSSADAQSVSPAALLGYMMPAQGLKRSGGQQGPQRAQQEAQPPAQQPGDSGSAAGQPGGAAGGSGSKSWVPESLQVASGAVKVTGEVNTGKLSLCISDGALLVPGEVRELLGKHLHFEVLQGASAIEEAAADEQPAAAAGSTAAAAGSSAAAGAAASSSKRPPPPAAAKWVRQRPAVLLPWGTGMPQMPVQLRLDGELMQFSLQGWQTTKGFTYLRRPVEARMRFTPALSKYLLTHLHPLLGGTVGMKGATVVEARLIPHDGLLPTSQATVRVEPLSVEIGESPVLRSTVGVLGEVVKKLKLSAGARAELSPLQATLGSDGRLTAERLDVRIKTGLGPWSKGLHLISWGSASLRPPQSLDATLAVPGDALVSLGLPELPEGTGLPLHISGTPSKPEVEVGRASKQLALLVAKQQAAKLGGGKGGAIQFLVDQVQQIGGTPESIGVPLPPPLPPTVR